MFMRFIWLAVRVSVTSRLNKSLFVSHTIAFNAVYKIKSSFNYSIDDSYLHTHRDSEFRGKQKQISDSSRRRGKNERNFGVRQEISHSNHSRVFTEIRNHGCGVVDVFLFWVNCCRLLLLHFVCEYHREVWLHLVIKIWRDPDKKAHAFKEFCRSIKRSQKCLFYRNECF